MLIPMYNLLPWHSIHNRISCSVIFLSVSCIIPSNLGMSSATVCVSCTQIVRSVCTTDGGHRMVAETFGVVRLLWLVKYRLLLRVIFTLATQAQ